MKFGELFRQMPGANKNKLRAVWEKEIRAVTSSPDEAGEESVFVCTRTALSDGQYLVHMAYARGCRVFVARHDPMLPRDAILFLDDEPEKMLAVMAARLYGHPAREMTVFGVCGSAGKTTAILIAESILKKSGHRVGIVTPQVSRCDGFLLPGTGILPDAGKMQYILALLRRHGCEIVLLECTSYQLMHGTFAEIPFAATLLVGYDYREMECGVHRGEGEYREALETLLCSTAPFCFLPAGENRVRAAEHAIRFGSGGNLVARDILPAEQNGIQGRRFTALFGGREYPVFLPVPGDFAVRDALAAAELCLVADVSPAETFSALGEVLPTGTLELLGERNGARIYRDSAFKPVTLERAIETLRAITKGRLVVLFGSVGARTYRRRAPLALAAAKADFLYLSADDPDTEDPERICEELVGSLPPGVRYTILPDRKNALMCATENLCPGDVLLLAGKGLYPTQKIMGRALPFDEKELLFPQNTVK